MRRSDEASAVGGHAGDAPPSALDAAGPSDSAAPPGDGSTPGSSDGAGGVLLLGKLMRRHRRFLTWKWRDFVLERSRLQYFSEKGNRKGDVPLSPTTPITIRMCSEPKPFGFLLFIKDRKLTLAASSERERRQWIDVFCDVFHAIVEQAPADSKAERRERPTFLPIPDINKDGDDHNSSASNLLSHQQSASVGTQRQSDADDDDGQSTPVMTPELLESFHAPSSMERASYGMDVIPILESRMTYGPLKEVYSRVTFPPSLANGDLLVGVGPIVRRMGWTDERILAVGLYIDPERAADELRALDGRTAKSLHGDQQFYDQLLFHTTFRRSFVVTARKRVSKSVLSALLHDELAPRMGPHADALQTFLGFLDKSLKKAESMVLRVHEDGRLEFRLRGQLYPPIASRALGKCVQALFFDSHAIQHDAKRGLVERLPSLWGGEVLDAQDEIFGSLRGKIAALDSDDDDDDDALELDDDDEDDSDDSEAEDLFGIAELDDEDSDAELERRAQDGDDEEDKAGARRRSRSRTRSRHVHARRASTHDEWAEQDEKELELLRRESRSLMVHFGPLLDPDSSAVFSGDLLVDGSALLGTWSQQFSLSPAQLDAPHDAQSFRYTLGLYVDPGAGSDALLKYKGLSIGSVVQDSNFAQRFAAGAFTKHLVLKVDAKMALRTLLEYLDARLLALLVSLDEERAQTPAGLVALWDAAHAHAHAREQPLELTPKDELRFSIAADGAMTMRVRKRGGAAKEDKKTSASASPGDESTASVPSSAMGERTTVDTSGAAGTKDAGGGAAGSKATSSATLPSESELALPPPPFMLAFQSLFYGFHAMEPSARTQLLQRLPNLLDAARDDLEHTYHDEIVALKENYKRQKPENRVKVGYLLVALEKRKMQKKADKRGAKEPTLVASRWAKRWCRLDGTLFSYYSHKRSRKYRDMMELTRCAVAEITSADTTPELARFAWEQGDGASIRIAIVKPNGETLALRTESIYEGEEWLESLIDASNVRRGDGPWDAPGTHLRRRSSSRGLLGPSGAPGASGHAERRASGDDEALASQQPHADVVAGDEEDEEDEEDVAELAELEDEHKDGSLLAWVQEDARHAVIAALLLVVVWMASVLQSHKMAELARGQLP